jgi:hypothetical protein
MKVTHLTKATSIKVNTLQFANADIYVSATVELADGDDPKEAGTYLQKTMEAEVKEIKDFLDSADPQLFKKPACLD